MSLHIDRKQPDWGYIDLHGLHTRRDAEKLHETIRDGLRAAYEAGLRELTLIHGHGFNRASYRPQFVNSNTGWLGQTVRRILRHDTELRQWMLAKFDCAHNAQHDGSHSKIGFETMTNGEPQHQTFGAVSQTWCKLDGPHVLHVRQNQPPAEIDKLALPQPHDRHILRRRHVVASPNAESGALRAEELPECLRMGGDPAATAHYLPFASSFLSRRW